MGCVVNIDGDNVIVPKKALLALYYIVRQMGTNDAMQYIWDILDGTLTERNVNKYFKDYQAYWGDDKCYRCYVKRVDENVESSSQNIHSELGFEVSAKSQETMLSVIGEVSSWIARTVNIAKKFKYTADFGDIPFGNRHLLNKYIHQREYIEIPLFDKEGIAYNIVVEEV